MVSESKEELDVLAKYQTILKGLNIMRPMGKVVQITGMSLVTEGPPDVIVGDMCRVESVDGVVHCEVVGFQGHRLILMPLGNTLGIGPNATVHAIGRRFSMPISDNILGRVLTGTGQPLDSKAPLLADTRTYADNDPPEPYARQTIRQPVETGVRAIDSMLTIGRGQRIGIFSGTGVGKSTLLGMIARYTDADVNVICLVGERGREVREFIEGDLGKEGLAKSVVIVATSDRPAMEKVYAAGIATSVAEYFRDQGKHVNLMMDSVTRYCMALREVGIASGEQIGPGGYPPGVWYKLSRLVERSGALAEGTITGFYTVLVEADDMNDPVADNSRGILDGHIVLSRRLAARAHYPSIEVTESISRVMDKIVSRSHLQDARRLRTILSEMRENEELVNLGAYARGSNPTLDEGLEKKAQINSFLQQDIEDHSPFKEAIESLHNLVFVPTEEDFY